jgi:hypothetical protein
MPADLRFASLQSHELLPCGREELLPSQPFRTTLLPDTVEPPGAVNEAPSALDALQ